MAEYTYRFADLLSDADVAELELSGVKFDRRIIQPGAFSANITVTNRDIAEQVKKIVPAKTVVHVYRDADIWGTYIIWSMRVRSSSRSGVNVEIQGASLESWLYKRVLDYDLEFEAEDQFNIARDLLDFAQAGWIPYQNSANLLIISQPGILSGVERDRTYLRTDAASFGQRLEELANVDNGFEYYINTYVDIDSSSRVREFVLAEELGSDILDSVYTYPGSILSYEINMDATEAATAFWARGESTQDDVVADSNALMTTAPDLAEDWLDQGFPHMDKVVDYSSVSDLETLEEYATWWADTHPGYLSIPVIEINTVDTPTMITPSSLGSRAQFVIYDEYFGIANGQPEYSTIQRVVGIEVTPSQRGSAEKVRYVIEDRIDPTDIGE